MAASVAQRLAMWALDEWVPGSIPVRTIWDQNELHKIGSGLGFLSSAPE